MGFYINTRDDNLFEAGWEEILFFEGLGENPYRAIEDLVSRLQKSLEDKEQLRKIGRDLVKNILHKMGNWNLEKKEN